MKLNVALILIIMGTWTAGFGQANDKRIYLAGWEATFNGDEQCEAFIQTQCIDKATAGKVWSAIELVFHDNKLTKAYDLEEGDRQERQLSDNEIGLTYTECQPHQIYNLSSSPKGQSYLGGEPPSDFNIPKFEFIAPFQYLGKLSKSDEPFNWLPVDIHLTAPIYLNFNRLFIDYSDPLNPKVIDEESLSNTDNSFNGLKSDSEIFFKKVYIQGEKGEEFEHEIGHTGVPSWIQYPDIPFCPKSGKIMKFVCQLESDIGVEAMKSNIQPEDEWHRQYFDHLNFWGDGNMYIFFEPESKVACFIIQNT